MKVNNDNGVNMSQLRNWYGSGSDGSTPTEDQWRRVLDYPIDEPVTLINFFKFREKAAYPNDDAPAENGLSGQEAFIRYAAISIPTVERVGGKFLFVGPVEGTFMGDDEDWNLVAIGSYPNKAAFLNLCIDIGYREAFRHRPAACQGQKVVVCGG